MKNLVNLTLSLLLLSISSFGQAQYNYIQPQELSDGWKTNDISSQDIDTTALYQLFNQLVNGEHKIHSFLLIKNNQLIIEEYFDTNTINTQHDMRSTTKSIRSILMGIAIDKGYIESVDDPITKYLKHPIAEKNLSEKKAQITIKHLLTMSSGLDCNDWDKKSKGQEDRVARKKDILQYTLDLPIINDPGTVSNYCSMGAILVAEIISQASGMTIASFAAQYLFEPMGITNLSWGHTSNKEVIPSGKRTYMTSRDMAKIGLLILNEGNWNGQQVVSKAWVETATSAQTKITGAGYGFFWWDILFTINETEIYATTATGNGGQYIMIFPDLDMIAVFTGGAYNSQEDRIPFMIMNNVILPTFMTKGE